MPTGNNSIGVSFSVRGSDLQSYMDKIKQKADQLAKDMIENAKKESDVAKDQLKSYEKQITMLERKQKAEAESARMVAEFARNAKVVDIQSTISQQYTNLDNKLATGQISRGRYRKEILALDKSEIAQTQGADDSYRDELKRIKEQERDNKVLIRTMRENVDAVRTTSQQELIQMRRGDESLVDAINEDGDPSSRLANQLASQQHIEEQAKEKTNQKKDWNDLSTFRGFLKAIAVDRVGGMVASIPSAKNELDYVKPMMATMGMAMGGLLGNIIDAANIKFLGTGLGNTNFGALGIQLGEKFGEFAGAAIERTYKSRDELTSANYRLQALTGVNFGVDGIKADESGGTGLSAITKDLAQYGSDFKETAELQYKIAMSQGSGKGLGKSVENALALQQGLGISQDNFLSLTELLRSSTKDNRDVMQLIGGIMTAGRGNIFSQDRTFLGEFMQKNFTQLQKTLLQTQNHVASGTTFDLLRRFDSLGGPFEARDPRAMSLINTVQGSLTNPGSDNLKALSMIMLRRDNPEMDFFGLEKERQKGLSSSTYLKSMLSAIDGMGGSESMKKYNVAQMLGLGNNLEAAETLYNNRSALISGKISMNELMPDGEFSEGSIHQLGKDQTSVYTKSTAEIENAFIKSAVDGIAIVGSKMTQLFGKMMDGVADYVRAKVESMINGSNDTQVEAYQNRTFSPLNKGSNKISRKLGGDIYPSDYR